MTPLLVAAGAALGAVERGVALLAPAAVIGGFQDGLGSQQGAGEGIHAADMGVEQIFRVGGIAAGLGVEVDAAAAETATAIRTGLAETSMSAAAETASRRQRRAAGRA